MVEIGVQVSIEQNWICGSRSQRCQSIRFTLNEWILDRRANWTSTSNHMWVFFGISHQHGIWPYLTVLQRLQLNKLRWIATNWNHLKQICIFSFLSRSNGYARWCTFCSTFPWWWYVCECRPCARKLGQWSHRFSWSTFGRHSIRIPRWS